MKYSPSAQAVYGARYRNAGVSPGSATTTAVYSSAPYCLKRRDDLAHRRRLLPDCAVDAGDVRALLREDRVDGERGLADLAVADDEFALPASDRHERVDRPSSPCGAARRPDAARTTPGRRSLGGHPCCGHDGASTIHRTPERVHDTSEHALACRHPQEMPRAANVAAFSHAVFAPEQRDADLVFLEREREAERAALELDDLLAAHVAQTSDDGDAVADAHDAAGIAAAPRYSAPVRSPRAVREGACMRRRHSRTGRCSNPSRTARSMPDKPHRAGIEDHAARIAYIENRTGVHRGRDVDVQRDLPSGRRADELANEPGDTLVQGRSRAERHT